MKQNRLTFESEKLVVDYFEFKFHVLPESIKQKIVQFFFKLGFNSFDVDKKYRDVVQYSIQTNSNNQYQIQFVVNIRMEFVSLFRGIVQPFFISSQKKKRLTGTYLIVLILINSI
ncbi:MAG: hypothetical protein ABF289_04845 [Clostridiales bacterium]